MSGHRTIARAASLLLAAWLIVGCSESASPGRVVATPQAPVIVVPPGVVSKRTPDQVAQLMRIEIARNERSLGRALIQPRIVRIQLLREGEMFPLNHFDGTNPIDGSMGSEEGPGWMVEAVGTFVDFVGPAPSVDRLGMHGFHLWADTGSESWGFIPCWSRRPMRADEMEGTCR